MHSTGNSIQYSVMTYMGKESKKEWIYVYVYLNHFAVHLKLMEYCKSTIFLKRKNKEIVKCDKSALLNSEIYVVPKAGPYCTYCFHNA